MFQVGGNNVTFAANLNCCIIDMLAADGDKGRVLLPKTVYSNNRLTTQRTSINTPP